MNDVNKHTYTEDASCDAAWEEICPRILPPGYLKVDGGSNGAIWTTDKGMSIISTISREQDGKLWLHISCARKDGRIPTWDELVGVKEWLAGKDRTALQVIPKRSKYINHNPSCLHLWCCLDGDVTPDFTRGNGTL